MLEATRPPLEVIEEHLRVLLSRVPRILQDNVTKAFQQKGKILSTQNGRSENTVGVWPQLTYLVARQVSPSFDPLVAGRLAAGIECFMSALDLLDDLEDDDLTSIVMELGKPQVKTLSTVLLSLSYQAILSLTPRHMALQLVQTLTTTGLVATAGQHADLLAEQRATGDVTLDECMEIITNKSASLMEMVCRSGAQVACADADTCDQFARIGRLEGIAHQLNNDCHGLYESVHPRPGMGNTDIQRNKKTRPIIMAAQRGYDPLHLDTVPFEMREEYLRVIDEEIVLTWGLGRLYHERAYEQWQKIATRYTPDPALETLLHFDKMQEKGVRNPIP